MIKIAFLIHDLGGGGAEKVLINLVNNMDYSKFDITVIALFGGGVNEQFLSSKIKYKVVFNKCLPGNSKVMKLLSPKQLHKICVKDDYDIEVAYLEGPSARIISGCTNKKTKLVSWIHSEQKNIKGLIKNFRTKKEAIECYNKFNQIICVSEAVKEIFCNILNYKKECDVLYNTVESKKIRQLSMECAEEIDQDVFSIIVVGKLEQLKGVERLFRIVKKLVEEDRNIHLYVLGKGPLENSLKEYIRKNSLERNITMLGYQMNPYKYVAKCNLFVCASFAEGFSTATTEALIVGTPVCTVEVSGMKEMLGENNEYGIVCKNDEESLYESIKQLIDNPQQLEEYKRKAEIRGKNFSTEKTVSDVQKMLMSL